MKSGELPSDDAYVQVQDGHLALAGKRVRFWAGINGTPEWRKDCTSEDLVKAVDRIESYGFNMMRLWGVHRNFDKYPEGYTKGDGSHYDLHDELIAEFKRRGFKIWVGAGGTGGRAYAKDVDIIDDPATAAAWQEAIGEKGKDCAHFEATFWDPRLGAIAIRNNRLRMNHVNQHTGLRVGDDPVFAVWELTNEQWWMQKMVGGRWMKLDPIFKDALFQKWHDFLQNKYGSQESLITAWTGLLPGEDLAQRTVLLAPMRNAARTAALNDANVHAMEKLESEKTEYSREDFNVRRGRDVNEFFAGMLLDHKRRMAAAFKENGKSAKLCPLLWDTGMGYDGVNQLMHQEADAVSYCAYVGGLTHDESNGRYPWMSGLEYPPRICLDVPWLEHNKVEGKPFFAYEVNIGSPAKFRTEFPYRLVFLATIQDWDVVCWHTLSGGYDWRKEDPIVNTISSPGPSADQFNFHFDEVLISAIRAAGKIFVGQSLKPVENPTTFIYGRNTIFSPDSMDYAGSYGRNGRDMHPTTYLYGSRIRIDLDRDDDEIIGRTVPLMTWAHPNPLRPTDQMTYDWQKGYLRMDSPAVAAFTGFLAQYGQDQVDFANGVTLSKVSVLNDANAPYPVTPEENYVAIAVTSEDGLPLADCKKAMISAVSSSANTGLEVGRDPESPDRPGHVWQGSKVFKRGTLPVQFSRVACTITAPALSGMQYRMRDWHLNIIGEGTIAADGVLVIPGEKPIFFIELER